MKHIKFIALFLVVGLAYNCKTETKDLGYVTESHKDANGFSYETVKMILQDYVCIL